MFTEFATYVDKCEDAMKRLMRDMEHLETSKSKSRETRVLEWRENNTRLWEFFSSFRWFAHHEPLMLFEYRARLEMIFAKGGKEAAAALANHRRGFR